MSQSGQKPPIAVKRQLKPAPQSESEPKAGTPLQGAPPRPAERPRAANRPAGPHAKDVTSGSVEMTRCYLDPDPQDGLSDQQWLETLPLYAQLQGLPRCIFAEDALTYRRLWAARKAVVAAFHEARIAPRGARVGRLAPKAVAEVGRVPGPDVVLDQAEQPRELGALPDEGERRLRREGDGR